jgi:hypothetical protein
MHFVCVALNAAHASRETSCSMYFRYASKSDVQGSGGDDGDGNLLHAPQFPPRDLGLTRHTGQARTRAAAQVASPTKPSAGRPTESRELKAVMPGATKPGATSQKRAVATNGGNAQASPPATAAAAVTLLPTMRAPLAPADPASSRPAAAPQEPVGEGTLTVRQLVSPAETPERTKAPVPDVVSPIIESTVRAHAKKRKAEDARALQALNELVAGRTFLQKALEQAPELWDLWRGCGDPLLVVLFILFCAFCAGCCEPDHRVYSACAS